MSEDNPTTVPGTETNVAASESPVNAPSAVSLKEVVKTLTGREYKSDEDAAEGIKNTYQAITQKKPEPQMIIQQPSVQSTQSDDVQLLRQELQVSNWYQDHPEYKEVKGLITKFGSDPDKVVGDPEFKKVYDALKIASETQSKSTLSSNARLVSPKADDYAQDLERLRHDSSFTAEFLAKHKGVPMPTA